jgi:hypothetical protein
MFQFRPLMSTDHFPTRIIQRLSDTLSLPNVVNINARRKSGFSDADALDWNEKNSSSVLQVCKLVPKRCAAHDVSVAVTYWV